MFTEKSYFNFNNELIPIENIFNNYIHSDSNQDIPLYFLPGYRYPVVRREVPAYLKRYISYKPYMPWKCVALVCSVLRMLIYRDSPNFELLRYNKLLPNYGRQILNLEDTEDQIFNYLPYDITRNEISIIEDIIDQIFLQMNKFTKIDPNYIWNIDYETEFIILEKHETIGEFRYNEAIEYYKNNGYLDKRNDGFFIN